LLLNVSQSVSERQPKVEVSAVSQFKSPPATVNPNPAKSVMVSLETEIPEVKVCKSDQVLGVVVPKAKSKVPDVVIVPPVIGYVVAIDVIVPEPPLIPKVEVITLAGEDIEKGGIQETVNDISDENYQIVEGDSLWRIAVRAYDDGFRWSDIAEANDLENPGLIHPGNTLVIPR